MATTRRVPAEVYHPGEFIREELEARNWTQADLASILQKPLPAINEIITGKKAITPETARALGDAFGTGPELWLNLESQYRLALSTPSETDVSTRAHLYSIAPIKDMAKRGWIVHEGSTTALKDSLLEFFRSSTIEEVESRSFAARKSSGYASTTVAEWAWFCRARHMAESLSVSDYSEVAMRKGGLPRLHSLITSETEIRKVPKVLADYGIRFVVVERLPKMQVDGAAFWLDEKSPAIALSMRHDRIDGFWFTLAHEVSHILERDQPGLDNNLVGKDRIPTEDKPDIERRADTFAGNFLVPREEIDKFIMRIRPLYSKVRINQFANRIGVHPGIVVGQLQHRREIGWAHSREMLVKVKDIVTETAFHDGWGSEPEEE